MKTTLMLAALAVVLALPAAAGAHPERPAELPDHRKGSVPEIRRSGPSVVVCKPDSRACIARIYRGRGPKNTARRREQLRLLKRCRFRHIQDAVEAAASDYRVLVLPGVYREEGSARVPYPQQECAERMVEREGPDFLSYSGTAGNGVWVHDSKFHHNAIGLVTDSFAPGHPGQPQDCAKWERNWIYSNNEDLFNDERDAYCKETADAAWDRDPKKVCPVFQVPVGSGFLVAGGNGNIIRDNWIWDNWRQAGELLYVPATFRGEDDPTKLFDTSNANQITGNVLDRRPDGVVDRNGIGFKWDEEGQGNCWQDNESPLGDRLVNDPAQLPGCPSGNTLFPGNPLKIASHASCATWDPNEHADPPGCDWFVLPPEPR